VIGFGSTYDLHQSGALIFVNHPFPVLEEERLPTPALTLGEGYAKTPFEARSVVNVSGMSFGAISAPAVRSLSRGAAVAGEKVLPEILAELLEEVAQPADHRIVA